MRTSQKDFAPNGQRHHSNAILQLTCFGQVITNRVDVWFWNTTFNTLNRPARLRTFFGFTFFAIATLQVFPAFGVFCRAMEAAYDKSSLARPTVRRLEHLPGPGHGSPCEILSFYFSRRPVRLRPLIGCSWDGLSMSVTQKLKRLLPVHSAMSCRRVEIA